MGKGKSTYTAEKYEVAENCPKCGRKASEIERALNGGEQTDPPSNREILRRLKDAGLPTKVRGKRR